ncbi:uncharacterized protein EKO05_0008517 [Ascochyta rabiei]|uniref:Uncharacterized protein n=1 Tax=Didymella rabiei TaxID=5454 RepID=A0A163H5Y0_DIDRA|nr:uncharacterized protein EKO05_0008517 [Ascochyta rabiei]KZM25176.1 hypothetical protein ST47_g3656 [Ascochyta rabiei]UPX18211.1 hypothetical protein EKO05_0008517 [Ascochyta rabiei]
MQPYPAQHQADTDTHSHRGPLSRTWPQLFKKRRRYSPVRESAQSQAHPVQRVQQAQQPPPQQQQQYVQMQPQPQPPPQPQIQTSVPIRPIKRPSVSSQSIRSPSLAADTASTISTISEVSTQPPQPTKRVPIARRTSSIATTDSNAAGGVTTPQADLLASKSNYELISSGQHLEMGMHFSTAMATGVMMKRATHRAAEQARRDRMKTAMVDLAEFLLDGEVTFGSGTTCFVVMRGDGKEGGADGDKGSIFSETSGMSGLSGLSEGSGKGKPGEKKTVNKARLIEMALEKMRAQEKEIGLLRKEIEDLRCGDKMDET